MESYYIKFDKDGNDSLASFEDIQEGLENCPQTLNRLFIDQNFGNQLLKF